MPAKAAGFVLCLLWLSALSPQPSAFGAESAEDTLAKPLSTTVARLAEKSGLSAQDCSDLAQTTITYGQRVQSGQQHAPESVIRDALQGVDLGEKLDAKAADWPKLRADLEELLKKQEPPPQDKKDQDKQKQDQQNKDQQQDQKDQQQQNQDRQKSDDQKQQEQQDQQQQQQKQNQDAFGDMKDQSQEPKPQTPDPKSQPPKPGTQKVGGQQDKQPEEQNENPELAMPLQKLEQVRDQDSPAKLQQIMQGQQQKPKTPGKDW